MILANSPMFSARAIRPLLAIFQVREDFTNVTNDDFDDLQLFNNCLGRPFVFPVILFDLTQEQGPAAVCVPGPW